MKVVNWNVQWATRRSGRSPEILRRIGRHNPDIACLMETDRRLLSEWDGQVIEARPDPVQGPAGNRRKVLLWSRQRWADVNDLGSDRLPPGRFLAGTTETPMGQIRVCGVCIPWHNSGVNVGVKDRTPWQDHCAYLDGLSSILSSKSPTPLIVLGDFNQQIGQRRRPYPPLSHPVRTKSQETMAAVGPPGLTIASAGLGLRGRRAIDHMAISGELSAVSLTTIDNMDGDRRLSDHFGVVADLYTRGEPQSSTVEE